MNDTILEMFDEFEPFYNRVIDHYSKADSKISAVADLAVYRDELDRELKDLYSKVDTCIDEMVQVLTDHLHYDRIMNHNLEELKNERDGILAHIRKSVVDRDHINDWDRMLEQKTASIREFYKQRLPNSDPEVAISVINKILLRGEEIRHLEFTARVIKDVLSMVIRNGYPKEFKRWKELDSIERSEMRPHNYIEGTFELDIIQKLREFRGKGINRSMGVNKFFQKAHSEIEGCRYLVNQNGEKTEISWSTLKNRIQESHEDIFTGNV